MANYTYTVYTLLGTVVRSDGVTVSPCQSTDDPLFVEYNDWVMAGNKPFIDDFTKPVVIPERVNAVQLRLALNQMGIRDKVETAIQNSTQDIKDLWDYTVNFNYIDPILNQFAQQLNVDLGQIFILAATFPY